MEQNKGSEVVERKRGGYRTIPLIIGDDPFDQIIYIMVFLLAQSCFTATEVKEF